LLCEKDALKNVAKILAQDPGKIPYVGAPTIQQAIESSLLAFKRNQPTLGDAGKKVNNPADSDR
jgi:hypothetical protein